MKKYIFYKGYNQKEQLSQFKILSDKIDQKKVAVVAPTFKIFEDFCREKMDSFQSGRDISTEGNLYIYAYDDKVRGYRFDAIEEYASYLIPMHEYLEIMNILDISLIKQ